MVVTASANQVWTKINHHKLRLFFCHSDPDLSSVNYYFFFTTLFHFVTVKSKGSSKFGHLWDSNVVFFISLMTKSNSFGKLIRWFWRFWQFWRLFCAFGNPEFEVDPITIIYFLLIKFNLSAQYSTFSIHKFSLA